jgi:hypothetical protein
MSSNICRQNKKALVDQDSRLKVGFMDAANRFKISETFDEALRFSEFDIRVYIRLR